MSLPHFIRRSLAWKISAVIVAVVVISVVVRSLILFTNERAAARRDLEERTFRFARYAAPEVNDAFIRFRADPASDSFRVFGERFRGVLAVEPDVRGVRIIGTDGVLLFDSDEMDAGVPYQGPERFVTDGALLSLVRSDMPVTRMSVHGESGWEVIVPISSDGARTGHAVVFSVSLESVRERERELLKSLFIANAVPLVVALLLLALVLPSLTRPLRRLRDVVGRSSFGNADVRIPESTGDEVTDLTNAFRGMVADITDRSQKLAQRAEEAEQARRAMLNVLEDLSASKEELEGAYAFDSALLASLADGLIAVDTAGRVTEINEPALNMLGMRRDEAIGSVISEWTKYTDADGVPVPKDQRPSLKAMALSAGQVIRDSDHYIRGGNDALIPVAVESSPIIIGGQVRGSILLFRDITQEKQIDRAKSEFVSLASHQLRTPLTSIGWYAELLLAESGNLNDQQRQYVTQIRHQHRRMTDLVGALLDVSRIELGMLSAASETVSPVPLIKRLLAQYAATESGRNLVIREEYDDQVGSAALDGQVLAVILDNLISNAFAYTPKGQISVSASVRDGVFVFSIADSGIGIPASQQGKVFTKFFRADNARQSTAEGNGLGLYLVKSILDRLGGSISFTSEENVGSTFTVRIPTRASA